MPFDPTKPMANTPLDANGVRYQFNALKALWDAQAVTITSQGAEIAMLQGQVAGLLSALDSVPPGQPTLALQYAGGLDVPMMVTAPRANTVLVQRRYQPERCGGIPAGTGHWPVLSGDSPDSRAHHARTEW